MVSERVECFVDNWLQCFVIVVLQKQKGKEEDDEGKKKEATCYVDLPIMHFDCYRLIMGKYVN